MRISWRLSVACALATAVSAVGLAPASEASTDAAGPPLSTSVATSTATFATMPMGNLSDPLNTFWQLFELKSSSGRWLLDTPPGIADNGGLVVDPQAGGSVDVGLLPSDLLHFTATIVESRTGEWAQSAVIPTALTRGADSLAGPAETPFAVTSGGAVLSGVKSHWSTVTDVRALESAASRDCGVTTVNAVAHEPTGSLIVGTSCNSGDDAGIFTVADGSTRLLGPRLSPLGRGETRVVVRLAVQDGAIVAVVLTSGPRGASLVSLTEDRTTLTQTRGANWQVSSALALDTGDSVLGAGAAGGLSQFVVFAGSTLRAAVGSSRGWRLLPTLPSGTKTLAYPSPGRVDALSERGTTFTDSVLDASGKGWVERQHIDVPILYGSSG